MPLLALGSHKFEIAPMSFQQLEDETIAEWKSIGRFGGRPGWQFTAFGEDPIRISGLLYPDELGGRDAIDALRETQRQKAPVLMVGCLRMSAPLPKCLVALPSARSAVRRPTSTPSDKAERLPTISAWCRSATRPARPQGGSDGDTTSSSYRDRRGRRYDRRPRVL